MAGNVVKVTDALTDARPKTAVKGRRWVGLTFAILLAMKTREYTLLVEQDEDGIYVGEVLELPGCHTQAPDPATLRERIKEAVAVYLEALSEPEGSRFVALERLVV